MPDGTLLHLRDTYPTETAWVPKWTGDDLRQARTGAWEARLAAIRATAESDAATRQDRRDEAARQRDLAASYHAMREFPGLPAGYAPVIVGTRGQSRGSHDQGC